MALARTSVTSRPGATLRVLGDEGFRLFFPLGALHAALWPVLWVLVYGFVLPGARGMPSGAWHAQEMLVGAFGAALIGFLTTAVPEWTDTPRLQGRKLFALAAAWGAARLVGLLGTDALVPLAAVADFAWFAALFVYLLHVSWRRRTTRLLAFVGWLGALAAAQLVVRAAFVAGDVAAAQAALRITVLLYLGLVGLVLARVTVPVTNLVLDPTEQSSPFRPHPGRLNLAPGLVALAVGGELAGLSAAVSGYLWIAAGAAFMDRVAEAFVGREALRAELLALAGTSALAGIGLMLVGAGRLGAPIAPTTALHVATMGGLGLGVLTVFSIAGLLHAGQPLRFSATTRVALALLPIGLLLRVAPDLGWLDLPGPPYGLASIVWAGGFLLWLRAYWPLLSDPRTLGVRQC